MIRGIRFIHLVSDCGIDPRGDDDPAWFGEAGQSFGKRNGIKILHFLNRFPFALNVPVPGTSIITFQPPSSRSRALL